MKKKLLIILLIVLSILVVFLLFTGINLSKMSKSSEKTTYDVLVNKGKKVTKSQIKKKLVGYISFDQDSTKYSKKVSYKSFSLYPRLRKTSLVIFKILSSFV